MGLPLPFPVMVPAISKYSKTASMGTLGAVPDFWMLIAPLSPRPTQPNMNPRITRSSSATNSVVISQASPTGATSICTNLIFCFLAIFLTSVGFAHLVFARAKGWLYAVSLRWYKNILLRGCLGGGRHTNIPRSFHLEGVWGNWFPHAPCILFTCYGTYKSRHARADIALVSQGKAVVSASSLWCYPPPGKSAKVAGDNPDLRAWCLGPRPERFVPGSSKKNQAKVANLRLRVLEIANLGGPGSPPYHLLRALDSSQLVVTFMERSTRFSSGLYSRIASNTQKDDLLSDASLPPSSR